MEGLATVNCWKVDSLGSWHKKHITSKHSVHKCKVCQKEFKNSMDLVSHVAKEHLEDEEALSVQSTSTPNSDRGGKHTSFVFSESMLDEFLW